MKESRPPPQDERRLEVELVINQAILNNISAWEHTVLYRPNTSACTKIENPGSTVIFGRQAKPAPDSQGHDMMLQVWVAVSTSSLLAGREILWFEPNRSISL